jgi:hypothetical protein
MGFAFVIWISVKILTIKYTPAPHSSRSMNRNSNFAVYQSVQFYREYYVASNATAFDMVI